MANFKFNEKALKGLGGQIVKDINAQQERNPVRVSDSQAERDRKIDKWIKDAGYGKR